MVSISTDFAADMSQKAWAKGSGSAEMFEPLKMLPSIQHFTVSNISAGLQKILIALEAHVADTEKLSKVRGKGRGRKEGQKGGKERRRNGKNSRWKQ